MISVQNLNKTYSKGLPAETHALRDVSLSVSRGEFVAVMGQSGCGKSTLLNILGCMDRADSGEYMLCGTPVHGKDLKQLQVLRRTYVSFIFQHFALMNQYSVRENVEIPLIAGGIPGRRRKQLVREQLEKLGIGEYMNRKPMELSGGQQQRVAIARALVDGRPLILADEPTGALDEETGERIMSILEQAHREGKTIILVTHDKCVAGHADRIIRMRDGRLLNATDLTTQG